MIFDFVSYRNQLEACRMTGGLVPHPAFQLLKSPSGLPMTTPWSVCAVGQPVQPPKPVFEFRFPAVSPAPASGPVLSCPSVYVPPPVTRALPDESEPWSDLQFCPRAAFRNVWTDYNVCRNGEDGMEIHAAFEIDNSQNREFRAIAFFHADDGYGDPVPTNAEGFQTTTGGLCVSEYFKPPYQFTVYRDFRLFLPYRTMPFGNGFVWRLKFYIVLREENRSETELAKSNWQRFTLT
jgi:hypothetical protein